MPKEEAENFSPEKILNSMNHSELVLMALWVGIKASRAFPREELIQAILKLEPFDMTPNADSEKAPMDKQEILSGWLKRNWSRVQMSVPKRVCPSCFKCSTSQVLFCFERFRSRMYGGN